MSNKLPKPIVFFDMDGVLADFYPHAKAHDKLDAKGEAKWDELDYKWWISMPVCDGAKAVYDSVYTKYPELEARILSAPALSEESFAGKAHWVQQFHGGDRRSLSNLLLVAAKDKNLLARPNHILIDDRIKNVLQWREAGGIAIHHKGDFEVTRRELERALAEIQEHNKKSDIIR